MHKDTIPEYAVENVVKMLMCRDPKGLGYHRYACPNHPSEITVVPHTCKSRLCNACGSQATDAWIERVSNDFPDAPYYHITFTVSDKLRGYLLLLPEERHHLFQSAAEVIIGWFKERGILPAVICVLHTYGSDLKVHPHIHMVVSAGGLCLSAKNRWISCEFIPFRMLKKRWRAILLESLRDILPDVIREECYEKSWYVNVGIRLHNVKAAIGYTGRYTKKPVLAETRITEYDGVHVSFVYHDYVTERESMLTISVYEFMSLILQHLPPTGFHMIRYYGLLASRVKTGYMEVVQRLLQQVTCVVKTLTWRARQLLWKGVDPLVCSLCGHEKILVEIAWRTTDGCMRSKVV